LIDALLCIVIAGWPRTRSLSDIYLTIVQNVFAIGDPPTFGDSRNLAAEILA
jgi:hypothetical protein